MGGFVMVAAPKSPRGVLVVLGILAALLVGVYASTLGSIAVGIGLIAVILYGIYIVGYRFDDYLKNRL